MMSKVHSSSVAAGAARWPAVALLVVGIASFMVALDVTALNVALSSIGMDFKVSLSVLQWVASAYTVVFASLLLSAGALSDRLGARPVFVFALSVFTVASLCCGMAGSVAELIAARAAQGIGASMMVPSSMALLTHAFPAPGPRGRAVALWGGISAIALVAGPLLGGMLIETLGWRSIFYVNVPFCLLAVAGALLGAGRPAARRRGFDLPGQLLGMLALLAITFGLIEGHRWGARSPLTWGMAALAAAAVCGFIAVERRRMEPMLPLELFASPAFTASVGTGLLQTFAYYGALFVLPLALQASGMSPVAVGLALLPMTLATGVVATLSAKVGEIITPKMVATLGLASGAIGAALLASEGLRSWYLPAGGLLIGLGGATLPSIVSASLASVPGNLVGIGSGVFNAARQSGGALGVAILGSLLGGGGRDAGPALRMVAAAFAASALLALFRLYSTRRQHQAVRTSKQGA